MKPRRLHQLCGWSIARYFNRNVWHLHMTRNEDRLVLVEFLVTFARHFYGILTHRGIEDQLYRSLMVCLRNRVNPPVFLTAMLVYCPKVTIDQIAVLCEHKNNLLGSGVYLSEDECLGMLQVLAEYQKQQSVLMNQGKEKLVDSFMLPTTCLVLEGISFHDANYLSLLLEKMPNLSHISLQHNGTRGVLKTLSQHCKHLKSLCFLEPSIEASIKEKDMFSALFGIPSTNVPRPGNVVNKFEMNRRSRVDLDYWEEALPMFENLTTVELQKTRWNEKEIAKFCSLLSNKVRTFSLVEFPLSDMSCLINVTNLRLTLTRHYSFDKMHIILDGCPNLKTLSIHPTFYHEAARRQVGQDQLQVEQMMEEDLNILERLMFADGEVDVQPVLLVQQRALNYGNNEVRAGGEEALPNVRPAFRLRGVSRKKKKPHNLTTLRIASLCEAEQKQTEDFLREVLERLPNLRNLCLGMWMGSLSQRRQYLTCTANALVNVVADKERKELLLPHLTRLCCLPTGNEMEMCRSLASLVEVLPSLQTLVLPVLDMYMLSRTLKYFQHSSLDIQYKCATDQVFSYWGPEH
ncbi:hypothetical protein E2C01_012105 [Portunus trituberculatus]|uniref:Uncharacterized protein n=1 Tax=Portunus trituberculatus TaxID=210409 RepID=A0A5B7DDQ4_PORTR|nr:hypothetical protein [Portunus trituberculatus]